MSSDSDWIRITSRDGFSFLAKRNVVNASGRLKNMLDTESSFQEGISDEQEPTSFQTSNSQPQPHSASTHRPDPPSASSSTSQQSPDDPPTNKRTPLHSTDQNQRAYKCKREADNVRLWNRRIDGETTKKRTHRPPPPHSSYSPETE
ncbi:hypothetical protein EYR38_001671 [Pleurotus pulmonarius]|nr:hypothetical protein EYR38_001671 [Pleurotus pulmonarius]